MKLNLRRCDFFQPSVDYHYLGHVVLPGKLQVAACTTKDFCEARPIVNNTQLRSLLGICNFYHRFVPWFEKIGAPLNEMLKKGTLSVFESLTHKQYEAYQVLNECLVSPPVLALPRANKP